MTQRLYFAAPIDATNGEPVVPDWVDRLIDDFTVYVPQQAWRVNGEPNSRFINNVNNVALLESDVVLAWLPRSVPTVGVPIEILLASQAGIKVVVVSERDWVTLKDLDHVTRFSCWDDALDYLVPNGRVEATRPVFENLAFVHGTALSRDPNPTVKVKILHPHAQLPTKGYANDAGFDLYAATQVFIPAHQFADIPTGIAIALPNDCWCMVTTRSSIIRNHQLMGVGGVIDPGYRGELFIAVVNYSDQDVAIPKGAKVGQFLPMAGIAHDWTIERVRDLPESERGTAGFGSTGV